MADWLFYLFASLSVLSAFLVAVSRNPVNGAMSMIVAFVGVAALFVLLETYFLGIIQILVYAGAIIVLFLFIIMLIDAEHAPRAGLVTTLASLAALGLLVTGAWTLAFSGHSGPLTRETLAPAPADTVYRFGVELFTRHVLEFQLAGFLLLVAMIGVIVISRKHAEDTEVEPV